MKVLFVASGNAKKITEIAPFIKAQGEKLKEEGLEISYFAVMGKGIMGYLKNARRLKDFLKTNSFDLIHAHYGLCGWVAVLARPKVPVVLSLMGDDAYGTYYKPNRVLFSSRYLTVLTWLIQPFVNGIISKSKNIERFVYRKKISYLIPNGVRLDNFQDYGRDFREELGLDPKGKYVLFLGRKEDINKNFLLVKNAIELINDDAVKLLSPYPISRDSVVKYLWSADVFVLPSLMEGSPNVVKEAMACNCPIVATNAGDAYWLIDGIEGCYKATHDVRDFSEKILMAIDFSKKNKRTNGRQHLVNLGLDADSVAHKVINVYQKALKHR